MINAFTNKNFVEELNIPYFQKTMGKVRLKGYFTGRDIEKCIAENELLFDHF